MSGAPPGQVSLDELSLEQLNSVKQQLEEELKHLTTAFGDLKTAESKFKACMDALDSLTPANQDKKVLVPLTSSLYVPGKIKNVDTVMVDVGTGYFVEKSTKAAKTLYNSKILALRSSLATLQGQIETKNNNANACVQVMRQKLAQQQAQQQAAGGAPAN